MSRTSGVGLPEALERAASALSEYADAIRPANGDPSQLAAGLEPDAAARVLEWLLANEPADGEELATTWAEDAGGAEPLLRVRDDALPKEGRKALRRVRHRLRSRGVDVREEAPTRKEATLPPVEEKIDAALLTPLDPRGARIGYLAQSHPSGGARVFEAVLDEERGVVQFEVYATGRSKTRRFLRELSQRGPMAAVEVPPESLRALIARIAAGHPADRPLPRAFTEWGARIAEGAAEAATPGELAVTELGAAADAGAALARVAELVRAGEVGPWPPANEQLHGIAEKLNEVAQGKIIVSGARKREQADRVIEEALAEVYDERFAESTARRLEECAFVLMRREREDDARACLAAARAFREGAPAEQPVARAMLETVLAPVLGQIEEDESEEGSGESLLVKP